MRNSWGSAGTIELFDAFSGFGGREPGNRAVFASEKLLEEMNRIHIHRSLATTAPQALSDDVPWSNRALLEACGKSPRLVPCPVVVPDTAGDVASERARVEKLLAGGAGAVCIRPRPDR